MRRAATLLLALALLAPSFPFPLLAQEEESATMTPSTEETASSSPEEAVAPATPELTGEPALEESSFRIATESFSLTADERFIVDQSDASEQITFSGAAGGSGHPLSPPPVYTALGSGSVSKVRIYLSRSGDNSGATLQMVVESPVDGSHVCTLFRAGNYVAPGPTNYALIPASTEPALVEFVDPFGDCTLVEGVSYQFKLIHTVNGDPRWTNGVLHLKGSDDVSTFFLQVITDDPLPPPPSPPTPPPVVSGIIIAKSSDTAWDENKWDTRTSYGHPLQIGDNIVQEGTITHVVVPLGYYFDNPETPFQFYLRDAFGNSYDCFTELKTAAEWGIANGTGGHDWNTVTVGPFTGNGCDTAGRNFPIRGFTMYTYVVGDGGNLGVPGYIHENGRIEVPFIAYSATSTPVCTENCYSSVLFLPGIKGSVLRDGTNPQNKLWPPTVWSNDVQALALQENGESVRPVIVDGTLNDFYGTPIYGPYATFMDSLVSAGTIEEWLPMPYDWRFAPEKILTDGVQTPEGTKDIISELESLAARSRTGKVTIVGHSMGGVMGKAVIKELEEQGKADLIDSFIMVGSPQLGTPQGIASLLHGDDEAILGGHIVDATDVRDIGQNMQSAYNLMPSPAYFNEVTDPILVFNENAGFTAPWRTKFGTSSLNVYDKYEDFITNDGQFRAYPDPSDLLIPEVLREDLVNAAEAFHIEFDTYTLPEAIHAVQIAGWGIQTLKGVEYLNEEGQQAYQALFTREGDKTVVYPSAVSSTVDETFYFNLDAYQTFARANTSHRDLLNAEPVQVLIEAALKHQNTSALDFISQIKPQVANTTDQLLVSTHSPVVLGVYDEAGNFTGIRPEQAHNNDFVDIEENIPGSTFLIIGGDNYVFLPKNGKYTFNFKGTGSGAATLKKATVSGDITVTTATYTDIPINPQTSATFEINTSNNEETFIAVDGNGDGQPDSTVAPDGYVPPPTLAELFASLKIKVQSLDVKAKLKEKLLNKIEKIEKKIAKNKKQRASKVIMNLEAKVAKKAVKGKISDADAEAILDLLDQIESAL